MCARASVSGGVLPTPRCARSRAHPVPTVPVGQLAIEATVDMLAAGAEHMVVLDAERVCGILSAADLLGLDARGPIGLRHTILGGAGRGGADSRGLATAGPVCGAVRAPASARVISVACSASSTTRWWPG